MSEEIDKLLKPRVKVIADYPGSTYTVGEVIDGGPVIGWADRPAFYAKYPNIFKSLEWWEERQLADMSDYVKVKSEGLSVEFGEMCKAIKWGLFPDIGLNHGNEGHLFAVLTIKQTTDTHDKGEEVQIHVYHLKPATKAEYEAFIKAKVNENINAK